VLVSTSCTMPLTTFPFRWSAFVTISTVDPDCMAERQGVSFFIAICSKEMGDRYSTTLFLIEDKIRVV